MVLLSMIVAKPELDDDEELEFAPEAAEVAAPEPDAAAAELPEETV